MLERTQMGMTLFHIFSQSGDGALDDLEHGIVKDDRPARALGDVLRQRDGRHQGSAHRNMALSGHGGGLLGPAIERRLTKPGPTTCSLNEVRSGPAGFTQQFDARRRARAQRLEG